MLNQLQKAFNANKYKSTDEPIDSDIIEYSIEQILDIDKHFRYDGVNDDIFSLKQLQYKTWNNVYPTLNTKYYTKNEFVKRTNMRCVIDNIYKRYAFLQDLDLTNILIAGGCISNIIMGKLTVT